MTTSRTPWEELYPPTVPVDLSGDHRSMLAAWDHHVRTRPEAPSVHHFDVTLTFAAVDRAADALACGLIEHGLRPGDRVAIYLQNDPQWLVTMLAAWKSGAVPVAINPMLREAELAHHLADSSPSALVCLGSLYDDVVTAVLAEVPVATVVTTHPLDLTPDARVPAAVATHVGERGEHAGALQWRALLSRHDGRRPDPVDLGPQDIGALTYTSGTTGRSKGAMNLHRSMVHSSTVFTSWWDLRPDRDVVLGIAPLFHITGLVAGLGAHVVSGAPVVLLHRFDAETTLRAIDQWGATFTVAASTAFIALSNHPALSEVDVSTLTKTPSGGAAVSQALVDRVRAATGWRLHGAYGMTETTSPTHLGPVDVAAPVDPESGALAVGVPVPGARVRIVDPDSGRDLGPGGVGEIVVSGPMVVPGYWGLPEESAHAVRDGWLHTGDVGTTTEDGWLFVVDRLKDMINAGGYKIFPRDVEDVLYQHPAVREASVVGVPDEYRGETVKAFVSLVPGAAATPQELMEFCRERMAAYKYPRAVEILSELPKTLSGKVLRRELRGESAPQGRGD
ncbi:class I adenylate-forming enzyme family protein [Aeromicrobium sp. CTD01-1L150]|uniref:class I adenylate-forming enzyme family protein n=1 Tax=Aeromicrobium sp. CTD01-1L150 TaxID=3341830 RepID=UPI0035C1E2D9